jgi:hypothetical protein
MLALHTRIASVPVVVATPLVRVRAAAPTKRPYARFLTLLLRALSTPHA